jgi:hypothetical protein
MMPQAIRDRISPAWFTVYLIIAVGTLWMIILGVQSPGTSLHDEITHYFIARDSWSNPVIILDVWGRPGNTLFYMLPSLISLGARRWWALATCTLIAIIAVRSAARLGLRQLWWAALAFYLQPWVLQYGFTSITQVPFMLALVLGIDQWIRERRAWSSLCFGMLPLIRHEGLALTAAWMIYLAVDWCIRLFRSRSTAGVIRPLWVMSIALIPLVIWNALHYAVYGRLASGNLLEIRPTDIYGSGDWLHFVGPLVGNAGIGILLLALIGGWWVWRTRRSVLIFALPAALYFITHSLIYRFGLFASGGYIVFLLPMAPAFATFAGFGAEFLLGMLHKRISQHRGQSRQRYLPVALLSVMLIVNLTFALAVKPWQLQPNEIAAQEAADWLAEQGCTGVPVYSTHVWFFWVYEDRGELVIVPGGSKLTPEQVQPGALVLWDINYGDLNGIALADLRAPESGFAELRRFFQEQMILFQKTSDQASSSSFDQMTSATPAC